MTFWQIWLRQPMLQPPVSKPLRPCESGMSSAS